MSTVLAAQWHLYVVQVIPAPVQAEAVSCICLSSVQLAQSTCVAGRVQPWVYGYSCALHRDGSDIHSSGLLLWTLGGIAFRSLWVWRPLNESLLKVSKLLCLLRSWLC